MSRANFDCLSVVPPAIGRMSLTLFVTVISAGIISSTANATGDVWEPFVAFPASDSGRTDAVAMVHQGTIFVLGGEPYRCPPGPPCQEPERGAADYLPPAGVDWLQGEPFDDRLQRMGGGIDGLGRPFAFGAARHDAATGGDQAFFYDIVLGDQTEPTLARRTFLHTNFAWTVDHLGRVYAVGGGPGKSATPAAPNAADMERYDAGSDSWTVLAPMPEPRANAAAAFDGQGHILVFGGYDANATSRTDAVLSYDIAGDSWSVLTTLPMPPEGDNRFSDQRAHLGANGTVYVVGGINGPVGSGATRPWVYTYEPVNALWGFAPELSVPRHGTALAMDDDGWLYALGGRNGASGLNSSERLDTSPTGTECVIADDCSDGMACNGAEFCVDGSCLAGIPVDCVAGEYCASGGACRVQRYSILDLSALLDDASGTANAINTAGEVVGEYFSSAAGEWQGFRYDGQIHNLGSGRPRALSDDGWIAGEDATAFLIDPNTGIRHDLGTLGGLGSGAYGVTTGGWTVGQSDTATGPDHAFLVRGPGAPMEDLGTLGDYSIAHGISPAGLIVGESLVTSFDPHAEPFVFDAAVPGASIEVMPGVFSAGSARGINNFSHVTGWTSSNVDNWGHGFVQVAGSVSNLGSMPGKSYSIATAINNADQVVGYAFGEWVDSGCCGPIWSNAIKRAWIHDGSVGANLNDELPEESGWVLTLATGINDAGAITGTGTLDGVGRAFLMLPLALDGDADGVADAIDNCPDQANTAQDNADGDLFGDACDLCTLVANDDQRDSDNDGYGNACDPDLNNDCSVNFVDLGAFKNVFLSNDPHADFNGDGSVNFVDLGVLKNYFLLPPGPGVPGHGCAAMQ